MGRLENSEALLNDYNPNCFFVTSEPKDENDSCTTASCQGRANIERSFLQHNLHNDSDLMPNRPRLFPLLLLLALVPASALAQNPNPSPALDAFIYEEMGLENIPGMSTLIVKGGEIVWVESYGLADIENDIPVSDSTAFLMASVSKLFTGTALMQLHESGQLDLDEDINNHLPFDVNIPNHLDSPITFRMLMTHTSSIQDNGAVMDTYYSFGDPTITLADCMERYFSASGADYNAQNNFSNGAPGTNFDYSNMATALAGYLVEVISGELFDQYSNTNLFEPLCMHNTAWYLSEFDTLQVARPYQFQGGQFSPFSHYGFADYPNGLLRSSVKDLANFMIAYLQGGAFNGDQLLSEPSIEEMLTLQIQGIENTQGLNWYQTEIYLSGGGVVDLWGHNGGESGATTDLYIDPENEIGVVVLSNAEGENLYVVDELYDYALALSTSGVGNPACGTVSVAEASIGEVPPSLYPNPASGAFTIASESGGLFILYSAQGKEVLREEVGPREQMSTSKLEVGHYTGRLNNAYFKLIIQ